MNYEEGQIEELESSIEHWISQNHKDAVNALGEDLVSAVKEEFNSNEWG